MSSEAGFVFETFELRPARRQFLKDGKPAPLGGRAFDILHLLAERAGQVVPPRDLLDHVWPNLTVDDGALRVHMAALRKALGVDAAGKSYILNVPGRGYMLTATAQGATAAVVQAPDKSAHRVPAALGRIFGRAAVVADLEAALAQDRLVTLAGPGGIGKTTVALAVARGLEARLPDGACLVELAAIVDPALLPGVLLSTLGVPGTGAKPAEDLAAFLAPREMLLVLDNCEHVIDAAALLAETLLRAAPRLRIIATSREALRAEGERVVRLEPLGLPDQGVALGVAEAMAYPALELLVDRARANDAAFALSLAEIEPAVEVCRRLDGIPLALELAAARIHDFGVAGLLARLNDRFGVLTEGRRTALPRQQTLKAAFDWSYDLLDGVEQQALRRLSIFRGRFSLASAQAVAAEDGASPLEMVDQLASLIAKNLVVAETRQNPALYGLLETTRAYAAERLATTEAVAPLAHRHADHVCEVSEAALGGWTLATARTLRDSHGYWIEDVRAALDWTCVGQGDLRLAGRIITATAPLWQDLSLVGELHERVKTALSVAVSSDRNDPELEMSLSNVVGHTIFETGIGVGMAEAFSRALEIARQLSDDTQALRAMIGLFQQRITAGEYEYCAGLSHEIGDSAERLGRRDADLFRNRTQGFARHLMGEQPVAAPYLDRALADPAVLTRAHDSNGFEFDPLVFSLAIRSRVHWLQGRAEAAQADVARALAEAQGLGHMSSLYFLMAVSVPLVAFWTGEEAAIDQAIGIVSERRAALSSDHWGWWERTLKFAQEVRREGAAPTEAHRRLMARLDDFSLFSQEILVTLHDGLVSPPLIERLAAGMPSWAGPETLRAQGQLALAAEDLPTAERLLDQAMALARSQGALAWELRTAMTFVDLRRRQGDPARGLDELAGVYRRFSEGHGTADLRRAAALLA